MPHSRWTKLISDQSHLRVVAIEATQLVQEFIDRHQLSDVGGEGLGEAAIGLLLIASAQKDGNRVNLSIRGDGLLKQVVVDAYPEGHVRGYIVENPNSTNKKAGPWGGGILSVLYTKYEESDQPYIGSVPLLTGHLAPDLTHFWLQSAQLPSVVGLDVKVKSGRAIKADGLLIQTLGSASPEERTLIYALSDRIQQLTESIGPSRDLQKVLNDAIPNQKFTILEDTRLSFHCSCSEDRVERAIILTGAEEMQAMIDKGEEVKAHCEFCNTEYKLSVERLKLLKKVNY